MEETTILVNDTIIAHVRQIDDNITTLTALMIILLVVGGAYLINKILYHVLAKVMQFVRKE